MEDGSTVSLISCDSIIQVYIVTALLSSKKDNSDAYLVLINV